MSKHIYQSIVVYDNGPGEQPSKRFDVDLTWFKSRRAAQRDANQADTGTVVAFIPLNLDDPEIQALVGVLRLAFLYEQELTEPTELGGLRLLRAIFHAGRESALTK